MRSRLAGRMPVLVVAFLVTVSGAVALGAPIAAHAAADPVAPVSPVDGASVPADPELTWTAAREADGYEVLWNTDASVDPGTGTLDRRAGGGRAVVASTSYRIADAAPTTHYWQVRALPDGPWSEVATFSVDVQLETLPVPDETEQPEAGAGDIRNGIPGAVWIGIASAFAVVLLAVVFREWWRIRQAA